MAHHDALTDLPNRTLFDQRMNESIERVRQTAGHFTVMCLDLDRFKTVNDTLGTLLKYQDDISRIKGSEAERLLTEVKAEIAAG